MTVNPVGAQIVVQRLKTETQSPGGIVLPDAAQKPADRAVVLAVGAGEMLASGQRATPLIQVDQIVLLTPYAGSDAIVDGQTITFVRETDILATLES